MSPIPQSIIRALSLSPDPSKSSLSGLGSGFSTTGCITARVPSETGEEDEERKFFVKTSPDGEEMFRGEYASLNAIADSVPGFCPRALAWGSLLEEKKKGHFLVTEFLDLGGGGGASGSRKSTLAQSLGKLHTTPAPPPPDGDKPMFGFPVATFCGDSRQPNKFRESWADFYANERLMMILAESERRNGSDGHLRDLVEQTSFVVVPRLLDDGHLGYDKKNGTGQGIFPVVVHGDLWSGNASRGRIVRKLGEEETGVSDVVYDPCACYAHNEYELGIMHMFGGFGRAFFNEYHKIVPKTEPVEEYDDRIKLYEL
jgi:protein-ribulosamine 3-kinase